MATTIACRRRLLRRSYLAAPTRCRQYEGVVDTFV
jgi:hypothetical protein